MNSSLNRLPLLAAPGSLFTEMFLVDPTETFRALRFDGALIEVAPERLGGMVFFRALRKKIANDDFTNQKLKTGKVL